MADLTTNSSTSTTETAVNVDENLGGDPTQTVNSAKGENAVSTTSYTKISV